MLHDLKSANGLEIRLIMGILPQKFAIAAGSPRLDARKADMDHA